MQELKATIPVSSLQETAKRSGLRIEVLQEIREIANRCGIQRLVLFGSRARGSNKKYSDIDLACQGGNVTLFSLDVDEETSTALKFDVVDLDESLSPEFRAAIEEEGIPFPETAEQERIQSSWAAGSRCSGRSTTCAKTLRVDGDGIESTASGTARGWETGQLQKRYHSFASNLEAFQDVEILLADEAARDNLLRSYIRSGAVRKFSTQVELAWRLLAELLAEKEGVSAELVRSPRSTMMEAQAVYEDSFDGDLWIDMLGARNRIAHTYSDKRLQELVDMIRAKYIPAFRDLQMYILARYGSETLEVESNRIVSE